MTASIFFIASPCPGLRLQDISFFAMDAQIEALNLVVLLDAQSDNHIADLENEQRPDDRQHPRDRHADRLIGYLAGVSVNQAERRRFASRILQSVVDGVRREHAGQDGAERSSSAMHSESVESIV